VRGAEGDREQSDSHQEKIEVCDDNAYEARHLPIFKANFGASKDETAETGGSIFIYSIRKKADTGILHRFFL
jgi:hypothetical protein